jgi:hypothetical protein
VLSTPSEELPPTESERPDVQATKPDSSASVVPGIYKPPPTVVPGITKSPPKRTEVVKKDDDEVSKAVSAVGNAIANFAQKQIFEPTKKAVEAKVEEIVTDIKNIPSSAQKAAAKAVDDTVESVVETINDIPKNVQKAAVNAGDSVQKAILKSIDNAKNAAIKNAQVRLW